MSKNQTEQQLVVDGVTASMVVIADHTTHPRYWDTKESRFLASSKSFAWWEDRTREEREAVLWFVREGLAVAMDSVQTWLPTATHMDDNGDRITIMLQIMKIDIDAMVATQKRYTKTKLAKMTEEGRRLLAED